MNQAGSTLKHGSFLFDFSYDKKVSNEDLQKVETLCNELIAKNMQVYVEEA